MGDVPACHIQMSWSCDFTLCCFGSYVDVCGFPKSLGSPKSSKIKGFYHGFGVPPCPEPPRNAICIVSKRHSIDQHRLCRYVDDCRCIGTSYGLFFSWKTIVRFAAGYLQTGLLIAS